MWIDELRWVTINTSLALIPVAAAYTFEWLARRPGRGRVPTKAATVLSGLIWLLFLPNTCYLLTEWRHFLDTVGYTNLYAHWQGDSWLAMRLMMYTLFYLCFSSVGVLTFAIAIRPVARIARERGFTMWIWGMLLFLLNSVGVYLGLIRRFNSWDPIVRPGEVWAAVAGLLDRPALVFLVFAFAGFLWLAYLIVDIWVDGATCRWRSWQERREAELHG